MWSGLFGSKKDALEVVESRLKAQDWKYTRVDERTVLTGFRAGPGAVLLHVRNEPGKRALLLMANALPSAGNAFAALEAGRPPVLCVHAKTGYSEQQVQRVCENLLARNYRFAVGGFERDSSDGEVRFRIGLPYRDSLPTEDQIAWCIAATAEAMSEFLRDLGDLGAGKQGMEI
jgi:hypothetical protein